MRRETERQTYGRTGCLWRLASRLERSLWAALALALPHQAVNTTRIDMTVTIIDATLAGAMLALPVNMSVRGTAPMTATDPEDATGAEA
jgi:hypothetical protein